MLILAYWTVLYSALGANLTATNFLALTKRTPCAGALPESPHPYGNFLDVRWTNTCPGARALEITFDSRSHFEWLYDYVYVTDASGTNVQGSPFTGSDLAGKKVVVPGDTVIIRLDTDGAISDWGFAISNVVALEAEAAPTLLSREPLTLYWQVHHEGVDLSGEAWMDTAFLCTEPTWNSNAIALRFRFPSDAHITGDTYSHWVTADTPIVEAGDYFLLLNVDGRHTLEETNEADNELAIPLHVQNIDLAATAFTVPTFAAPQQVIPMTWTVTNLSSQLALPYWYDLVFYNSNSAYYVVRDQPLPAHESYRVTYDFLVPSLPAGMHELHLYVNESLAGEANPNNNVRTVDISIIPPDLVVSTASAPGTVLAGEWFSASLVVSNDGALAAYPSWSDSVYLSTTNRWTSDAVLVGEAGRWEAVHPDGQYAEQFALNLPALGVGDLFLLFVVDAHNNLFDVNTNNNVLALPIHVLAADLLPTTFNAGASVIAPNERVTVTWTVANQGSGIAGQGWFDQILLATDPTGSNVVADLGAFWHPDPVPLFGNYPGTANVLIPRVPAGNYFLVLKVDSGGYQPEGDEPNNTLSVPITITGADLVLESITAPASVAPQQSFTISWTVRNLGPSTAYAPWDDIAYIARTNLLLPADSLLQLASIQPLAPGAAYTQTQTVRLSSLLPGNYFLVLNTDYPSLFGEDTNNMAAIPIRIQAPDLAALAMNAPPAGLLQSNAQASILVSNAGPATAFQPWDVQFYISETNRWLPDSIYVGATQADVDLAPGTATWLTAPLQLSGPIAGQHFLIGRVDRVRTSDTNTRNNEISIPIGIQSADLVAESFGVLQPSDTCPGHFAQSLHPYPEAYLLATNHHCPSANALGVFFDSQSDTGPDMIEIMDAARQPIPGSPFTGSELAAAGVVIVPGDTVVIHFAANHGVSRWGFGISHIVSLRGATNVVAAAQQKLDFQWMISNRGNGPALRTWNDSIALLVTRGFPSLSQMENTSAEKALLSGDWYYRRMQANLPPVKPGRYEVILNADSDYSVEEATKENNTRSIHVEIRSPDLALLDLQAPGSVAGQSTFEVIWRVQNVGGVEAFPDWMDRLYISRTNRFTAEATEISWEPHHTSLATNASYTVTQFVTLPALNGGDYFLIAKADADNALFDSSAANNEFAVPINIQKADLTPTHFASVVFGGLLAVPPQSSVGLTYTVQNLGPAGAAYGWHDQIYLSQDAVLNPQDVPLLHDQPGPAELNAGATYIRSVTAQIPGFPAGDYFLIFQANSGGDLAETDFSNNTRTVPIHLAAVDLEVTAFTATNQAAPKQVIPVTWSVRNNGPAALFPAWYDSFYLSSSPDWNSNVIFVSASWQNENVPAGNGYSGVTTLMLPNVPPGDYYLLARADSENDLSDANPANSVRSTPITIILPDLVALSFSGASTTNLFASPQGEIEVYWSVTNAGPGQASPQWTDRFYLSTNSILDDSAIWVDELHLGQAVAAGAVYEQTATLQLGAIPAGQYQLLLEVDGSHSLRELSDTNNVLAVPITISGPADLSAVSLTTPATLETHQHFSMVGLSWTVTNQGVANAGTYWVDDIYLSRDQQLDPGDTAVGSFPRVYPLAPGDTYTATQNVVLPITTSGRYYLILMVDGRACAGGCVYEMTETNNLITVAIDINLIMPDLVVKQFNVPRYVASSQDSPVVQFVWEVRNEGGSAIEGSWTDNLYIGGHRVYSAFRDGPLAPGASYTNTFLEYLSHPVSDIYSASIQIDDPADCNCVSELSEENNSSNAVFTVTSSPGDIVLAGETSTVSLMLNSEIHIASVELDVFADPTNIVNIRALYGLPSTDLGGGWYHLQLSTVGPDDPTSWQQQTSPLQFQALPNQRSCFVSLSVDNVVGYDSAGGVISDVDALGPRIVILGAEPLVEITPLDRSRHLLTIYGLPGTNAFVDTKISYIAGPWTAIWNGTLTNRFHHAGPYTVNNTVRFYRARY